MSTLKVDTLQNAVGENLVFTNKNLLINGGMNIWQRGTTEPGITTSAYRTADRWLTSFTSMGTWTQSRSTDVPSAQGFGYSLKMDCTTADASPAAGDGIVINQRIEGQNLQHLLKGTSSAKKITLSFWVKSNKTGTYIIELFDQDNSRNICQSYTIDSASTWEKKTITFEGDTTGTLDNDNAASLYVQWWLGAGSNFTSGTLQTSWGTITSANRAVGQVNLADSTSNEWYMTGCQLEVGSVATDFEFEPYETVLRKCQRYFHQNDYNLSGMWIGGTAELAFVSVTYPVTMRDNPDVNYISGGVARSRQTDLNISSLYSGLPVYSNATSGASLVYSLSSGNGVIGEGTVVRNVNMKFDAEL